MKKTCKTKLLGTFAVGALIVATGCQSTGNAIQTTTNSSPATVESKSAALELQPAVAKPELQTVYFEYNRWVLPDEARRALRSNAEHLQASSEPGVVTVTGHCDERGSEEYNLALGERRAETVKRYLVDLGVPASRVRTLSFGEGRPAVPGEGEVVWSRNRRAELSLDTRQASR
jgi:peptidoglycan-associated lipoprotein